MHIILQQEDLTFDNYFFDEKYADYTFIWEDTRIVYLVLLVQPTI